MKIDEIIEKEREVSETGDEFRYDTPPCICEELLVLMNNMQFRRAKIIPTLDAYNLYFIDYSHPMQNAYCNRLEIVKWKKVNPLIGN
jgi:hypothetical protein